MRVYEGYGRDHPTQFTFKGVPNAKFHAFLAGFISQSLFILYWADMQSMIKVVYYETSGSFDPVMTQYLAVLSVCVQKCKEQNYTF